MKLFVYIYKIQSCMQHLNAPCITALHSPGKFCSVEMNKVFLLVLMHPECRVFHHRLCLVCVCDLITRVETRVLHKGKVNPTSPWFSFSLI